MPNDIGELLEYIRRNRFIPVPTPEQSFVGDGDFLSVGIEFLDYFVRLCGLRPDSSVLEIGSGIGRMALPLTQFLSESGTYVGIDVVGEGVAWSEQNITSRYRNFRFSCIDIGHPLYNPNGSIRAENYSFPFPSDSFDLIILTSVFTHLGPTETGNYAKEVSRLLKPDGRCLATFFLLNGDAWEGLSRSNTRISFDPKQVGPAYFSSRSTPLAAVGYDETWLLTLFSNLGLFADVHHGHWSGRPGGLSYQDICVIRRS